MATWKPAPSVAAALKEATARWPGRSRASDGILGDAAHSARVSDHNPDARGIVHAFDLTDDPVGGVDCDDLSALLVAKKDKRVRYIIWNRRIIYGPWSTGVLAKTAKPWIWHVYDGVNAHKKHMHVSVGYSAAAENDVSPWWGAGQEEDDMAALFDNTKEFEAAVERAVDHIMSQGLTGDRNGAMRSWASQLDQVKKGQEETAGLVRQLLLRAGGSE